MLLSTARRTAKRVTGPCERCGEFAGPQQRRVEIQTKECLAVCRQGEVSYDLEALVTGKAVYGMDARVDGMVYASVEHRPFSAAK